MDKIGRLCREAGYVQKGARGVNAPHMTSLEFARLMICAMASESPTVGIERLETLASLPFEDTGKKPQHHELTFEKAFALLIDKCGADSVLDSLKKNWSVELDPSFMTAEIRADSFDENMPDERHVFSSLFSGEEVDLPFIAGLERRSTIRAKALVWIAKAVSGAPIPETRQALDDWRGQFIAKQDARIADAAGREVV